MTRPVSAERSWASTEGYRTVRHRYRFMMILTSCPSLTNGGAP